jgi:hypothetical protein
MRCGAVEELAGYEGRLATLDSRLAVLTALVGVNTAISLVILWVTVRILERLA